MADRLRNATSPYLLQHADNPVDWWPWGDEAFAEARRRDVPVLLSVGYSACHWCHVMAHESFEDEADRPDRERQRRADQGRPRGAPRRRRGLYDRDAGHDRPGWLADDGLPDARPRALLLRYVLSRASISSSWSWPSPGPGARTGRTSLARRARSPGYWPKRRTARDRRGRRGRGAGRRRGRTGRPGAGLPVAAEICDAAVTLLARRYDSRRGGFGGAPKFPPSTVLEFLLRHASESSAAAPAGQSRARGQALAMVAGTAAAMARGGIYDQLGGGFARYSVDADGSCRISRRCSTTTPS